MKGKKSKSCANRTDRRLSVRIRGGKAAKVPIMPTPPPAPLTDLHFFKWKLFGKQFMAKYPNTSAADLHCAALVEWKTMSDADKAPFVKMAEESAKEYDTRREEFGKKISEYKYLYAAYCKNSQDSVMKDGKSKSHANRTDSKLSVRNGGGKAAMGPVRPKRPPCPHFDIDFFKRVFSKQFRAKYPYCTYAVLDHAAFAEWETMSYVDKAPYVKMAEESTEKYEMRMKEFRKRITEYNEYIYAADYKNNQAATNVEEEVRINLAGLMIRQ